MFQGLSTPFQRYWLIGLLIVWGLLLFGGFIFNGSVDGTRRMPTWTRMASSGTLVLAAFSWYAFTRGTAASHYALLIALGVTFGFIGDLLLAGVLPFGAQFIPGLVSFGIGHLFYITAMLRFSAAAGLTNPTIRWGALAFWLLFGLIGWYIVVYRGALITGGSPTVVHWIALPYALLLAATTGVATGLALQDSRFVPLAVGAGLFLVSDLILAGNKFSGLTMPLIGDVIWLTYGPAQMLIVYSIGHFLTRLSK